MTKNLQVGEKFTNSDHGKIRFSIKWTELCNKFAPVALEQATREIKRTLD